MKRDYSSRFILKDFNPVLPSLNNEIFVLTLFHKLMIMKNMSSKIFFEPSVGGCHNGRLVLFATMHCPHKELECWSKCTLDSREFDTCCPYPNRKEGYEALSKSFIYQLNLFLNDEYERYEEKKNITFPKFTTALGEVLKIDPFYGKKEIWDMFISTELCQHFTKQKKTKFSDFRDFDFDALIELINIYNINRILVCGSPGFRFIREMSKKKEYIDWSEKFIDAWHHIMKIGEKEIDIIYCYHPSFSGFRCEDEKGYSILIKVLEQFFYADKIELDWE